MVREQDMKQARKKRLPPVWAAFRGLAG